MPPRSLQTAPPGKPGPPCQTRAPQPAQPGSDRHLRNKSAPRFPVTGQRRHGRAEIVQTCACAGPSFWPVRSDFRVFRDHNSRSEHRSLGTQIVAGLGSQFRGSLFVRFVTLLFNSCPVPALSRQSISRFTPRTTHLPRRSASPAFGFVIRHSDWPLRLGVCHLAFGIRHSISALCFRNFSFSHSTTPPLHHSKPSRK
jgi:hypothetical protein